MIRMEMTGVGRWAGSGNMHCTIHNALAADLRGRRRLTRDQPTIILAAISLAYLQYYRGGSAALLNDTNWSGIFACTAKISDR
jgi:hypothetical protein